ncbi:MAG TPA: hypothetical protein VHT75_05540 [Acidimicrobiales bacterium]|jgi:hypothetical protein|nr:hypothetical protein [Acidimicrobiales bacterium]
MQWSVGLEAQADREMSREEIVELADAVAPSNGFATGIGTTRYGAQLMVLAGSREEAITKATAEFVRCATAAGLPIGPIVRVEAASEEDDDDEDYIS